MDGWMDGWGKRQRIVQPLLRTMWRFCKESTYYAGDLGSIPGLERSPEEGKGYQLQYSGLENSMESMGSQRVGHDWATFTFTKKLTMGLPWWLSGKESICQCRRHGFNPWSRNILLASGQWSLCSRARELQLLKPTCSRVHAPQEEKPLHWEVHPTQLESSPRLPQLEKVHAAMKTQHSQK